jgi:hypothetical protein
LHHKAGFLYSTGLKDKSMRVAADLSGIQIGELSTSLQKFTNVFLQRSQAAACWVAGNLESKAARSLRVNFHAKGLAVASQ